MDAEIKQNWIDALRSGKYTQGKAALKVQVNKDSNEGPKFSHCCLGVLCEVLGLQSEVTKEFSPHGQLMWKFIHESNEHGNVGYLPMPLKKQIDSVKTMKLFSVP